MTATQKPGGAKSDGSLSLTPPGVDPLLTQSGAVQAHLDGVLHPNDLPDRIAAEHEACCRAAGEAISHAMNCGDLLRLAKAGCEHGAWRQ